MQHITDNGIIDSFQSAYKAGHSWETALLRVYNDIVITIGKGNGSFLVLLDLSAAFDTIDYDNLFMILLLEKFVGINGRVLTFTSLLSLASVGAISSLAASVGSDAILV